MSEKSDKLRAMLEKEKERRIKLNNRIEILERRIQEEDSAEVNEMVLSATESDNEFCRSERRKNCRKYSLWSRWKTGKSLSCMCG